MSRRARIVRRTRGALATFLETEASGGIILVAAAAAGMLWANLLPGYETFWHTELKVGGVENDLQHWVNDGLMTLFFLVVGLEIKRELVTGELREARVAALPAAAALGGMVMPALVYLAVSGGGEAAPGWAIPMATDIAFVVGALALLGSRVPSGLKLFLLTLAIVDDIGAIVVIALVYSSGIEWFWLGVSAWALAMVVLMRLIWISQPIAYLVLGAAAWAAMLSSGIHPTLAGVALGLMIPARPIRGRAVLEDLERWLHPVSSYVVVPIFALANAGIVLTAESIGASATSGVFWGVALGLLLGKTVGITGASFVAERLRFARRPRGVSMRHVTGGAALAGIGFTVSLFIAGLAFDNADLADQARMGVLAGSFVGGACGCLALALRCPGRRSSGTQSLSALRAVFGVGAVLWLVQGLRFGITGGHSNLGRTLVVLFVVGTSTLLVRVAVWPWVQGKAVRKRIVCEPSSSLITSSPARLRLRDGGAPPPEACDE